MTMSLRVTDILDCRTKKLSLRHWQRKVACRQYQVEERQQIILQHRFASSVLCWAWFEEFELCLNSIQKLLAPILARRHQSCGHNEIIWVKWCKNLHDGRGAKPVQRMTVPSIHINPSGSAPTSWPAWWPTSCTAAMRWKNATLASCGHFACQVSALSCSCADRNGLLDEYIERHFLRLIGLIGWSNFLYESTLESPCLPSQKQPSW